MALEITIADRTCLLVNMTSAAELSEQWQEATEGLTMPFKIDFASTPETAPLTLESGSVAAMIVFATEDSEALQLLLRSFQNNVGALGTLQAVVCDSPNPTLLANTFEYGIDTFLGFANWPSQIIRLATQIARSLSLPGNTEQMIIKLTRNLRKGDQAAILQSEKSFRAGAPSEFQAAFARGRALEAIGQFAEAEAAYRVAKILNKYFRPASACLAEILLMTGKTDEAVTLLEELARTNPTNAERRACLAIGHAENGNLLLANTCVSEAVKISPNQSRVIEAQAQLYLSSGKVAEAFKLVEQMTDVGPFFAKKLNEMGVKLSDSGKGKSALALYQKTHKIVRPELRHQTSLNAALACYRLQEFEMGLRYLQRCEKEYGSAFAKLIKVRQAMQEGIVKRLESKAEQKVANE